MLALVGYLTLHAGQNADRWGRCMEVYGEDPTTIAKLGAAYITG